MKRRELLSNIALGLSAIAVVASTNVAVADTLAARKNTDPESMQQFKSGTSGDTGIGGLKGNGRPGTHGLDHDTDAQLDVWVARCNDAGGGMVTAPDDNYECHDRNGDPIQDW
ncbi:MULTISPECIES: hypothetical protein [unclassified Roseovarius]|uniref:hypothetical protein n=1 Tax=unclassified Roseovarius TaxID=2614913 RepID=UPI00273D9F8A|nr:hypothetical protein [Roseovarius sp. MMSF_3350]